MTTGQQADSRKIKEAEEAREALVAALRRAGVQLPATDVRVPLGAGRATYAFVNLGECSAPVARDLAAVIEKGAGR
ncbi:hypothetical protein GCM10012287_53110 [Streptomyces daqingensis]|uniref:Uncharacterized protein n=1 Tax=Streptomyces daqingensis TaxID=1472640 RepID=A0ABQ2MT75_9ACTN|nr:hypothetical protein [Streptomyces daqingensis]GGO57374.1 hypothetical protein GCM10012287_53110 [Streptomyces daqingensis]